MNKYTWEKSSYKVRNYGKSLGRELPLHLVTDELGREFQTEHFRGGAIAVCDRLGYEWTLTPDMKLPRLAENHEDLVAGAVHAMLNRDN